MALVMFDYDGVIVDSLDVFISRFSQACLENGFQGINEPKDVISLFEGNVYETMMSRGISEVAIDDILKRYEILQGEQLTDLELFDGIGKALQRISEKHHVYVITSNLSSATKQILNRNGITCFEDVIGAEKEKSKIKKIHNTMALHPGISAYYVGDTKGDMIEGKHAGTQTIGVTWGWHTPQKINEGNPDFLVNSPEELADFLVKV
ncbi:HAD family hydrolase [Desulfosporosinus nitroreducens]|uniref:HAD family hydrolase n=1 Tax=Desulfosporosinus nitroreducens TaxID=2018668 RepID=A0ABT8QWW9_9FIRM|nr:HAD family hydrolase [Desulfosporosinus nitroreducens]MCO1604568.1 HAD family hydrolase [Desulfosporosinus nitroreducens]MDO0825838.1 HAD family hydrolase [Desulfosporosinus nitroreducens]